MFIYNDPDAALSDVNGAATCHVGGVMNKVMHRNLY